MSTPDNLTAVKRLARSRQPLALPGGYRLSVWLRRNLAPLARRTGVTVDRYAAAVVVVHVRRARRRGLL
jgi:hypothetical protein